MASDLKWEESLPNLFFPFTKLVSKTLLYVAFEGGTWAEYLKINI